MRKLTVLAAVAAILVAAPMFAVQRHIAPNATFANGLLPTSTNNNDTCDIGDAPAATLLLPYFEVDFSGANTKNTVFTIVNTSRFPQIAHVVLWTDWSFAALDFNVFLTGYDVQSISLRDIFANGQVAPNPANGGVGGTSVTGSVNGPGTSTTPTLATVQSRNAATAAGGVPANNSGAGSNPNFLAAVGTGAPNGCIAQPGAVPGTLLNDLRTVFTTGVGGAIIGSGCVDRLGGTHPNAIGYVTIDVVADCTTAMPSPGYFGADILFDNVLTGDYQQIVPGTSGGLTNSSGGAPLVHIRAIPEGGPVGSVPGTNLPFTFYDRYTGVPSAQAAGGVPTGRTIDRRQPLPSTWAARWIQGGTGGFNTNFQIWREGLGSPGGLATDCDTAAPNVPPANSALLITDEVRFDEFENAVGLASPPGQFSPTTGPLTASLPETSSTPTSQSLPFPPGITASNPSGVAPVAGWMYLNLANGGTGAADCRLTAQRAGFGPALCQRTTTQNWVTTVMTASPSFTALFDATWLGNGCTPAPVASASIAPASMRPAGGGTGASNLVCPPPLTIGVAVPGTPTVCAAGTQPPTPTP